MDRTSPGFHGSPQVAVAARPGGETAARDGAALGGGSPSAVGREGG